MARKKAKTTKKYIIRFNNNTHVGNKLYPGNQDIEIDRQTKNFFDKHNIKYKTVE